MFFVSRHNWNRSLISKALKILITEALDKQLRMKISDKFLNDVSMTHFQIYYS